ncbi:MAG: glycosyltransferase [Actinomycetota bacterium]
MKVSLISTVKDSGEHIGEFLESVRAQTRPPDEFVLVDGGSTDGTLDVLRSAEDLTLIEEPGANISRGRNVAIAAATHDVIAVSDADCVLAPDWLERLLAPLERGADVSMGAYRARADTFLEICMAAVAVPDPGELRADTFMPSSRSVAFRRAAFIEAGGYPEWLDRGEDMYFDIRLRESGARMDLAADAVAEWRVRPGLLEHWKQYSDYARYDAIAGMYPRRHAVRFAVYGGGALLLRPRRTGLVMLAALAGVAYAWKPIRRASRKLDERERRKAVAAVPALMAFTDAAKMAGYLRGTLERRRHTRER